METSSWTLYAVVLILCQCSPVLAKDNGQEGPQHEKINILDRLPALARRFDFYYTLEIDDFSNAAVNNMQLTYIANGEDVADIDALIKFLKTEAPAVTVVRSDDNPAVLRFVDESVAKLKENPLDRKISLSFSGTPDGLVAALHDAVRNLVAPRGGMIGVPIWRDDVSKFTISAKDQTVRAVLTDWLPLSDYSRCLWSSDTEMESPLESEVAFHGPVEFHPMLGETPFSAGPFSTGEVAYRLNPNTPEYVGEAIDFIDTHLSKKEPLQVRWAMLYLGKYKVEKGIPTLLKYLDYQYTNCQIVEESYPASKALEAIGQPAVTAALAAMATEKDATRLMLMCRVVTIVLGDGTKAIEAAAAAAGGEQADKIRAAAKAARGFVKPPTTRPS